MNLGMIEYAQQIMASQWVGAMLVTRIIMSVLLLAGISATATYTVIVGLQAVTAKGNRLLQRYLRKLRAEQYLQLVILPLYGAIVGGFISTALAIVVDPPPGSHDKNVSIAFILAIIAFAFGVAGPLTTSTLYADPKNLLIGERIDRLKNGDWTRDTKADAIQTIDKERAAITKKLNSKNSWFLMLLVLIIACDIGLLILDPHKGDASTGVVVQAIVIAAILGGLAARYLVRPMSLRSALTELDSYQAEADKLLSPAPASRPSHASPFHNHHNYHDLSVAFGGLLIGAVLTRLGAARRRTPRSG